MKKQEVDQHLSNGRDVISAPVQMIISIQQSVLLVRGMYAKFTTKLFAQSVENKLRSKELLWSKETACFNNIFKLMFIFFKETEGLIFVDFVKILIINLFN